MKFITDADWHNLLSDLVTAALDPADPETAIAEIVSAFVAPESCRAEIEADDRATFARYVERECRTPSGRLDMDEVIAEAQTEEEKAA